MSGPFSVHQGFSIDIPFTLTAPDGSVDTTSVATASSANPSVRVGIRPDNNRLAFVDGLSQTAAANVVVSATLGGVGFHDQVLIGVTAPPNLGAVTIGAAAGAEYPTPASR